MRAPLLASVSALLAIAVFASAQTPRSSLTHSIASRAEALRAEAAGSCAAFGHCDALVEAGRSNRMTAPAAGTGHGAIGASERGAGPFSVLWHAAGAGGVLPEPVTTSAEELATLWDDGFYWIEAVHGAGTEAAELELHEDPAPVD